MITAKLLGQGCECVVLEYQINKVLKIYMTRENAQHAIDNQHKAHEAGIAPQMFSDKPFIQYYRGGFDDLVYEYAIISERVRPAVCENFNDYDEYETPKNDKKYDKLVDAFECLFPFEGISDLHIGNLGWMPDGRLVAIDFGALSVWDIVT